MRQELFHNSLCVIDFCYLNLPVKHAEFEAADFSARWFPYRSA